MSLAPPTAERESEDIFFPMILLFAALLNRLIYCLLSRSADVVLTETAVIVLLLSSVIENETSTCSFP